MLGNEKHDLIKKPEDTPSDFIDVLCLLDDGEFVVSHRVHKVKIKWQLKGGGSTSRVVAWWQLPSVG